MDVIRVKFADGSMASLDAEALHALTNALWDLSAEGGSVATIGMLEHERRRAEWRRDVVSLSERETVVFRIALERSGITLH